MSADVNHTSENDVAILARFLGNEDGLLPHDFARYILERNVSDRDKARMHHLAVRNQDGDLTDSEKEELFGFAKATTLLSILKSRARHSLGITLDTRTDT